MRTYVTTLVVLTLRGETRALADVDLQAKYSIARTTTRVSDQLPELPDLLAQIGLSQKLQDFRGAQVQDTVTLLHVKAMDLRMLGLDRGQIDLVLATVQELQGMEQETVLTPGPLLEQRAATLYGRLYIDNSVRSFEYYQATFAGPVQFHHSDLVWAEPRSGCGLDTAAQDLTGKFAIVERGECTFIDKANSVAHTKAAAMLVVNSDGELFHLAAGRAGSSEEVDEIDPGPPDMAVVLLHHNALLALQKAAEVGGLRGRLIPLIHTPDQAASHPVLPEERAFAQEFEAGTLSVVGGSNDEAHEFLTSAFGTVIPPAPIRLAVAEPADACAPLTNAKAVAGAAVLVQRGGGCSFGDKALHVQAAGGRIAVFADNGHSALQRVGAASAQAEQLYIPAVLLTHRAGSALTAAVQDRHMLVSFTQDNSLTAPWMELSLIQWPEGNETAMLDLVAELESTATGERLQWIKDQKARLSGNTQQEATAEVQATGDQSIAVM